MQIPVRSERWFISQAITSNTGEALDKRTSKLPQSTDPAAFRSASSTAGLYARVGVQEPDQLAPGKHRPVLHLPCAMRLAARKDDAVTLAHPLGIVLAAAVDDQDFETVRSSDLPE